MMALEGIERVLQTEEAQDAEDLRHKTEEELGQRPTIIKCASLIKTVTESPHNSSASSKRAKRIWDHHFVSCALCHNNYSRCRLMDSHFCNECKCHVCSKCDCRVYHLSYQEELWAEDAEKAVETKKAKKSKKAKKKQKAKAKQAERKKVESSQAEAVQPQQTKTDESSGEAKSPEQIKNADQGATQKTTSSPPSRGTIESDAADSLSGGGGGGGIAVENNNGGADGSPLNNGVTETNSSGEAIDLVLYLQQTGSIIALAKLLDSLYGDEDEEDADKGGGGGEQQQQQKQRQHRALSTQ